MPLTAKQEEMRDQVALILIGSMKEGTWDAAVQTLDMYKGLLSEVDEADKKDLVRFLIEKIDFQKDNKMLPPQAAITAGIAVGAIPKPIADCFNALYPSMFAKRAEMGERVTRLLAVLGDAEPEKKARKSIFKKG